MKKIINWLRKTWRRIYNTVAWFSLLWKMEDRDGVEVYIILKKKIEDMCFTWRKAYREHTKEGQWDVYIDDLLEEYLMMEEMLCLLDRLIEDKYDCYSSRVNDHDKLFGMLQDNLLKMYV